MEIVEYFSIIIGVTHSLFALIISSSISSPERFFYFQFLYCGIIRKYKYPHRSSRYSAFSRVDVFIFCSFWFPWFSSRYFRLLEVCLWNRRCPNIHHVYILYSQLPFLRKCFTVYIHYFHEFVNRAFGSSMFTFYGRPSSLFFPLGLLFRSLILSHTGRAFPFWLFRLISCVIICIYFLCTYFVHRVVDFWLYLVLHRVYLPN